MLEERIVAEVWGIILRFLGTILNGIYTIIPSYGLAIILLTVLVRIVLIPLTVKQIRSMAAMSKLQPELKRLQAKYKTDRQKLNEEMMKLYREHGVNPLGGCLPLLMQMPVFIALYSVLRVAIVFDAGLPQPVAATVAFSKSTICAPVGTPALTGPGFTKIRCEDEKKIVQEFTIGTPVKQQKSKPAKEFTELPAYVTHCVPQLDASNKDRVIGFACSSPRGTGHLPIDGKLFRDILKDRATFLGMHLACSPTQATSKVAIKQCTVHGEAAGAGLIGYYVLVAFMMASTYYQQKQMAGQATGPQAKQMQMMGRVMPLFLGFISLNIPAGVIIYWSVSNLWTIGQQYFFLQRNQQPATAQGPAAGKGGNGQSGKGTPPAKPKPRQPKPKR
jgi:YidC/Oxa1 family membrane protein insertase